MSDEQAAYLSGSLLEAGADTTACTLVGFVQAMLVFPEVQEKAQEELDKVIGSSRLPTIDDMESLPYIRACVKETIRWMPTTILGAPHGLMQDDSYMGYRIPANATVICNVWYDGPVLSFSFFFSKAPLTPAFQGTPHGPK
jgi:cytochrome P450